MRSVSKLRSRSLARQSIARSVRPAAARIEQLRESLSHYLRPALDHIDASGGTRWHGDSLDLGAGSDMNHEIALHGVTHSPSTMMEAAAADGGAGIGRVLTQLAYCALESLP
jgi:hypothetical protein